MDWRTDFDEVTAATGRLVTTLRGLADADMRAPSALPGWSRGHLATHIARNADSLWNLLEWARTGTEIAQYPSPAARNADIESGAGRPAAALADDVEESAARLAGQVRALPEDAWHAPVQALAGWSHPAWFTVYRRWQEVEAHHVDLAAGHRVADWSGPYVRWALDDTLAGLTVLPGDKLGELAGARVAATDLDLAATFDHAPGGPEVTGPAHLLLGWLSGRADGTDLAVHPDGLAVRPDGPLPAPPPWPHPPAPGRLTLG
ncbi:hypothetical protein DPM19_28205 [Actinomadura craniellae]|uniref:Mycothiol-dependent maleylpyruvate isomerase metal-binding domain-containing protein n=2 Tax=Actinomadura craniellae TaxID=2231787 RepID=A0A365GYF1_9ACTN|nr:hypothetical protein DPM19_28205 [Actinomadura craniellae]